VRLGGVSIPAFPPERQPISGFDYWRQRRQNVDRTTSVQEDPPSDLQGSRIEPALGCVVCYELVQYYNLESRSYSLPREKYKNPSRSPQNFETAVQKGCGICSVLSEILGTFWKAGGKDELHFRFRGYPNAFTILDLANTETTRSWLPTGKLSLRPLFIESSKSAFLPSLMQCRYIRPLVSCA
jgi:hypothetical protein